MKAPNVRQCQRKPKSAVLATGYLAGESIAYRDAVKVISVGALDLHRRDLADAQRPAAF